MSDIICVTDINSCPEDILVRIERISRQHPKGLILRAKELPADEYKALAVKALEICSSHGTECILHNFANIAAELGAKSIHLPLQKLTDLHNDIKGRFEMTGASCHSVEDALTAEMAGADYITLGHIFPTDCKKGLPPRGLDFLSEVCKSVSIPVYAIGGISPGNIGSVRRAGASGACVMSGLMNCQPEKIREILDM